MLLTRSRLQLLILTSLVLLFWASVPSSQKNNQQQMVDAAANFLQKLNPELRAKAVIPFEDDERFNWHYIPRDRRGVSLKEMNGTQRAAAHELLHSALSTKGYKRTTEIIALEQILGELERNPRRDPELYYFTIFGTPSDTLPWGWRVEGHHLSLNYTSMTNELVSTTPAFWGSNPATVPFGPKKGLRILAAEEDLVRELVNSLSTQQRAQAIIATNAPRDIITGAERNARLSKFEGLRYSNMTAQQQTLLMQLIEEDVNNMRSDLAASQLLIDVTQRILFHEEHACAPKRFSVQARRNIKALIMTLYAKSLRVYIEFSNGKYSIIRALRACAP